MKRLLLLTVSILIGLTSCSDQLNANGDGEIIEPVSMQELSGDGYASSLLDVPGIEALAQSVLIENGLIEDYSDYTSKYFPDVAIIVNQKEMLKEVEYYGEVYQWPEIDLDSYSLVIGHFYTSGIGYCVSRQYIAKGLFKSTLYLEIGLETGIIYLSAKNNFFTALYPKLPDGKLEIKRLN